jgi:hypothetical protein
MPDGFNGYAQSASKNIANNQRAHVSVRRVISQARIQQSAAKEVAQP